MTAKPVRDLLFSKTRNQQQNLPIPIGTIRQIEIETPSPSPKVESETKSSTEMKDLMILNERGMSRSAHEFETRPDSFDAEKIIVPQARTGQPTPFKNNGDRCVTLYFYKKITLMHYTGFITPSSEDLIKHL